MKLEGNCFFEFKPDTFKSGKNTYISVLFIFEGLIGNRMGIERKSQKPL